MCDVSSLRSSASLCVVTERLSSPLSLVSLLHIYLSLAPHYHTHPKFFEFRDQFPSSCHPLGSNVLALCGMKPVAADKPSQNESTAGRGLRCTKFSPFDSTKSIHRGFKVSLLGWSNLCGPVSSEHPHGSEAFGHSSNVGQDSSG